MERFGRYELIKKLATGGMAEIFLARQAGIEGFEKVLVLKRILPHLAENEEFVEMFLHEARIAVRLNHPNIVQIYDLGEECGTYFIAMEYIHGEDARRIWRTCEKAGMALPIPLACRIAIDAAAGLYHAHTKCDSSGKPLNIIHRDISPQNLLISFEGAVKVVDFGIAKAADQATQTRSGVLKGKYSYMSPEQASGMEIDQRTDQFALGIVLHELLTFQRLFKRGNEIQTLTAVADCEVAPPSSINPNIPPELDAIVLKALAKNPDDRFKDMQEFQLALEEWLMATRQPSSSALLSNFLKSLYADRLALEAREQLPEPESEPSNGGQSLMSKRIQRRRSSLIAIPARNSIVPSEAQSSVLLSRPPTSTRSRRQAITAAIEDPLSENSSHSSRSSVSGSKSGSGRRHTPDRPVKRRKGTDVSSVSHRYDDEEKKSGSLGTVLGVLAVLALVGGGYYLHVTTEGGLPSALTRFGVSLPAPAVPSFPTPPEAAAPPAPGYLAAAGADAPGSDKIQLTVDVEPGGADVYFNGILMGQAPVTQSVQRVLKASLKITAPGYQERVEEVLLGDEPTKEFKFSLQKKQEKPDDRRDVRKGKGGAKRSGQGRADRERADAQERALSTAAADKAFEGAGDAEPKAPSPAESTDAPAATTGMVHVETSPVAKVFEGQKELCAKTPCDFELPTGRHRIVMRYPEDGCEMVRAFNLKAGQELSFDVQMSKGQLLVMATPWADVWLGSRKLGTTPFPKVSLCEGNYKLLLVNADLGKKKQVDVSVAPNDLTKVNVNMNE